MTCMWKPWFGSLGFKVLSFCAIPQTLSSTQSCHFYRFLSSLAASGCSGGGGGSSVVVKKVILSNFSSVLEDLRVRIREADFVAFDLEMTGVVSTPWRDSFEFDRSDVRYLKVKDSAEKFAVVQFGLCMFRWDASKGSFIAHPLNFYIYPRKELSIGGPSNEFLCQTSSISFLAKHQFDFNACIHEGISYLSKAQEAEALQDHRSAYENKSGSYWQDSGDYVEISAVRTSDLLFEERMKIRFHKWRESVLEYPHDSMLEGNRCVLNNIETDMVFYKMHPAIMLNGLTSHQLKLIQLILKKHFKEFLYVCVRDENCSLKKLVVYTDSEEDKASLMKDIQEDQLRSQNAKIHSAVGFRHIIDVLLSEKKLIVGFNCFLDITHMYAKFIGPLPFSMKDFALSVNKILPNIIDTKHLLSSNPLIQNLMKKSRKSLSSAFALLCPKISSESQNSTSHSFVKVDVQSDEQGSSYWNSGAKHEAGFDAFMTGCVFAQACSHLGIKFEQDSVHLAGNERLKAYINILCSSRNGGTVIDLKSGAERSVSAQKRKYPKIEFANIALIWGFSSKIKPKDVEECLGKVFGPDSVVSVFFLDRTASLVQFSRAELVKDFLVLKDSLEKDDGPITVLHPLWKLLEGGKTRAAYYDAYKEICQSPLSKLLFADQAAAVGIRAKAKITPVSLTASVPENHCSRRNDSDLQTRRVSFEAMACS